MDTHNQKHAPHCCVPFAKLVAGVRTLGCARCAELQPGMELTHKLTGKVHTLAGPLDWRKSGIGKS